MTTDVLCMKITRTDATVEGYTEHDQDLVVDGTTYLASGGYVPSSIERRSDLSPNNQNIVGLIDNSNITPAKLRGGVYDGARVDVLKVDWTNTATFSTLQVYFIGKIIVRQNSYIATLLSIENELNKPIGKVAGNRCDADLGDGRCKFSLSAVTGTVSAVTTAKRIFTDTGRTEADGLFNGGYLQWTSGANNGLRMDVKKYTLSTTTIELYEPMTGVIAATDTYNIYRGCDKTRETCRDEFSNTINFRQFPYSPGTSNLLSGNT